MEQYNREIEDKLSQEYKNNRKDPIVSKLSLNSKNLSETIINIRHIVTERKKCGKDAIVLFWGLCKLKQETEESSTLKKYLTEETWGDWEYQFGFSNQLLKRFPKPKSNQTKDIENYLNKQPEYREDEEIQAQILSFFPLIILEVVAKDTQISEVFHEKIENRCRELRQLKSYKTQKELLPHKKSTSAKKDLNGTKRADVATETLKPTTSDTTIFYISEEQEDEKISSPKENESAQSQDLIALLKFAEEYKTNDAYLRKVDTIVQNVEDDFFICYCLNQLTKGENQTGFNVLMDAVVNVSGEEKVADLAKMILATYGTEALKSMYTKYVSYASTEKAKSRFNFGDFMDIFFRYPINREMRNFLANICQQVSEIGKEGCGQVRRAQSNLAAFRAENTDKIINTIGDSVSDLESCIINMRASEKISVRNAAEELIDKIKRIHVALSECDIIPVTEIKDWAEQKIVAYDGELHDIQGDLKPNKKVKLNSIGLKSKIGKEICRAKVRSVQGDDTQ